MGPLSAATRHDRALDGDVNWLGTLRGSTVSHQQQLRGIRGSVCLTMSSVTGTGRGTCYGAYVLLQVFHAGGSPSLRPRFLFLLAFRFLIVSIPSFQEPRVLPHFYLAFSLSSRFLPRNLSITRFPPPFLACHLKLALESLGTNNVRILLLQRVN